MVIKAKKEDNNVKETQTKLAQIELELEHELKELQNQKDHIGGLLDRLEEIHQSADEACDSLGGAIDSLSEAHNELNNI